MPASAHKTTTDAAARLPRLLLIAAVAATFALALPAAADAASYVVDTSSDSGALTCTTPTTADGDCSLRGAITTANGTAATDVITFSSTFAIAIGTPLPDVTKPLTINAGAQNVVVTGSGGYSCAGVDYAIDITDPAAQPTQIRQLPFNGVCGRAIRSNVPAPSVNVGPRRSDGSVSINGATTPDATVVDVFTAKLVTVDGEADTNGFLAAVSASGSAYSYTPASVPTFADVYTATETTAAGTSNFAARAHTPGDLVSPLLNNVVATSNAQVRLDFNESLGGGSANAAAYALGMANTPRPIASASVFGNSVYLNSSLPWATGEAGSLSMTGNGHVVDLTGNELFGLPSAPVYAGPGEVDGPTISNYKLSPNRFCQRKTKVCKRGSTYIYITLNKPARVIFKVARGTARRSELVTFVHRLKAGRNKVKFDAQVSGRTLPATILTIRAVAQDVARTNSAPVDAVMRIVKNKRDL